MGLSRVADELRVTQLRVRLTFIEEGLFPGGAIREAGHLRRSLCRLDARLTQPARRCTRVSRTEPVRSLRREQDSGLTFPRRSKPMIRPRAG